MNTMSRRPFTTFKDFSKARQDFDQIPAIHDLARELPQTSKGNVYIMIMIEHFSKWVELVTLPDKLSHSTNQIFLQQVLSRFGAYAKCLIDQGLEF
jgi:hypothetical protein